MKRTNLGLIAALIGASLAFSSANAQVGLTSDFSGSSNWNWDGQTVADSDPVDAQGNPNYSIGGSGAYVLSASGGHANQDDDGYIFKNTGFNGTGLTSIYTSFDVSFSGISVIQPTNETTTRFFEIGSTQGNQGNAAQWSGAYSSIGFGIDATTIEFGVRVYDRFSSANAGGVNAYSFAGNTYRLDMETTIDPVLDTITVTLDVYENGAYQETIISSRARNAGDVDFSALAGYALGGISPGSNGQAYNGDITFDNFYAGATVIPEPRTYALMAGFLALGLVVLRRRRS